MIGVEWRALLLERLGIMTRMEAERIASDRNKHRSTFSYSAQKDDADCWYVAQWFGELCVNRFYEDLVLFPKGKDC
jgi:hypothetical protein